MYQVNRLNAINQQSVDMVELNELKQYRSEIDESQKDGDESQGSFLMVSTNLRMQQ